MVLELPRPIIQRGDDADVSLPQHEEREVPGVVLAVPGVEDGGGQWEGGDVFLHHRHRDVAVARSSREIEKILNGDFMVGFHDAIQFQGNREWRNLKELLGHLVNILPETCVSRPGVNIHDAAREIIICNCQDSSSDKIVINFADIQTSLLRILLNHLDIEALVCDVGHDVAVLPGHHPDHGLGVQLSALSSPT